MAEQEQNSVPNTGTIKISKIKLDPARELMANATSQIPIASHSRQGSGISAVEPTKIDPPAGVRKLSLKLKTDTPQESPNVPVTPPVVPAADNAAPAAPQKVDTTTMRLKIRRQPAAPAAMPVAPGTPSAGGAGEQSVASSNSPSKRITLKLRPISSGETSNDANETKATVVVQNPVAPPPPAVQNDDAAKTAAPTGVAAAPIPAVTKRPTVAIPAVTVDDIAAAQTVKIPAVSPVAAPTSAKEDADDATVKIARPTRSVAVGVPGSLIPNMEEKATAAAPATSTATAAQTIKLTAAMKPQHTETATSPVPKMKPIPTPVVPAPAPAEASAEQGSSTGTAAKTIKLTAAMKPQFTQTATSPVPKVKPLPAPPTAAPGRDPIAAKTIKLTAAVKPQHTETATAPVPKVDSTADLASAPTQVQSQPEQPSQVTNSAPTVAEKIVAPQTPASRPAASAPTIKLTPSVTSAANETVGTKTIKLTTPTPAAGLKKPDIASAPTVSADQSDAPGEEAPKKKGFGLSLKKPAALKKPAPAVTPSSATAAKPAATPTPAPAARKEEKAVASSGTKAEPGVVFLILSIVALLVLTFSAFIMTIQYLKMYEEKKINIPYWEELSGVKK